MNEAAPQEVGTAGDPGKNANVVYILYLVGLAVGITGIIGVVMAYVYKDDAPEWVQRHYQFQIRTFWIGALYIFVGCLLTFVLIGFLVLLFWAIWLIVRCVKGMQALEQKKAPANPKTWMF